MSHLNLNVSKKIDEFYVQGQATETQIKVIKDAINASPVLTKEMNSAVDKGEIIRFQFLSDLTNSNVQGSYDYSTKTLKINPELLNKEQEFIIFVLGHEVQHSLDEMPKLYKDNKDKLRTQANAYGFRDYTDEVILHIENLRDKEAKAEIAGFNAVVDKLKQNNSTLTLEQIYNSTHSAMRDFIDRYREQSGQYSYILKNNLELNPDMSLPMSNKNIQGMGQNFFHKDAYYPNSYAAESILAAQRAEWAANGSGSKINLNMTELGKLGITEEGLKAEGVDFKYINIIGYKDKVSNIENSKMENNIQRTQDVQENFFQLSPMVQKLAQQCEEKLIDCCNQKGITADSPQDFKNISMVLTAKAIENGMTKVEKLDIESRNSAVMVFILSHEPQVKFASVSANDVVNIPVQESIDKIKQIEQQRTQETQIQHTHAQGLYR